MLPPIDWTEFTVWCFPVALKMKGKRNQPVDAETETDIDTHSPNPGVTEHHLIDEIPEAVHACKETVVDCVHVIQEKTGISHERISSWLGTPTHHEHPHHGLVFNAYAQFTAGAIGGGSATYSTHWLDTVKVKMQSFPKLYNSGFFCVSHTLRNEGIKGLYQGATPAVMGMMAKTSVVFASYGIVEQTLIKLIHKQKIEELTIWHHAASGAMTGIVASFVLCPLELVKCRLQALEQSAIKSHMKDDGAFKVRRRPLHMLQDIMRNDGVRGLYRGLPGIWTKEVPGSFIYFGSYETAKATLRHFNESPDLSGRAVFLCGVFAGLCFCVTHPIESVKTRVQVMTALSDKKGFFEAFAHILRNEGIRPLCAGLKPSMLRACLYSGIQFVVYENVKDLCLEFHETAW